MPCCAAVIEMRGGSIEGIPHVDALDRMELVIDQFGLPGSKDLLALIAWYWYPAVSN